MAFILPSVVRYRSNVVSKQLVSVFRQPSKLHTTLSTQTTQQYCHRSEYPDDPKATELASTIIRPAVAQERGPVNSNLAVKRNTANYQLNKDALLVEFQEGGGACSTFDYIWLRDNCRCEKCFHPYTKQRLLSTFQIPLNIQPTQVVLEGEGFFVTWPDGHQSFLSLSFLLQNSYNPPINPARRSFPHRATEKKYLWDNSIINSMPHVSYKDIFSTDGLHRTGDFYVLEWLRKIDKYGFCLVDDVPPTPEATEKLLREIAFIRETHYGAFWDFTANMEHGDTAYTNLALGAHTDTTYFSDPAGLQLFHLLSPPTSHEGGKSLLVDGFAAAAKLRRESPEAYDMLSEVPIDTHASGGTDVAFRPLIPQPVLSHHPHTGELTIVRWNPDDRLPFCGRSGVSVKRLYQAIRDWESIIKSSSMELWTQMKMGQALIFDNHRILHGRSSFKGSRRLCGGYVNGDDYRSRLMSLEQRLSASSSRNL
ncbi:hypothetical protein PCASD_08355 [Puccinia coronata f. sp. avenae]|uniref:trimethyllysine dioxygenase n=1 Tax=Puccinia coronata f. sp. avenae TaxID=200324 RepID=A0A2N5USA8_9BASI|nr:hypothetical protein PCASD_08355 [Puccinia coronata f. sp. avenae]